MCHGHHGGALQIRHWLYSHQRSLCRSGWPDWFQLKSILLLEISLYCWLREIHSASWSTQNPLLDRSAKYSFSYFGRVLTLRYFRTPLAQQIHLASESSNGRTLKTVQQNNELICFCSTVWKVEPREVGFAAEWSQSTEHQCLEK